MPPKSAHSPQTPKTPWLVVPRPNPSAARRLVCFPHAGGSASFFRTWAQHLDPTVELQVVQYPGRENRIAEPLLGTMDEVASAAARALRADGRETILFGHSMGAAVAYEVLRILEADRASAVTRLCVSGRRLTGPSADRVITPLTDDELIASMGALGGTQSAILEDPDIRAMVLPILRNDYFLIDSYRPDPAAAPVTAEVVALTGDADPRVTEAQMKEWARITTGPFACHTFPGGHFYLAEHSAALARIATADI
ncbi:thioesterase II family protein [Streptomyces sp. NBRC 110611]|uniref:thioesterase II family protein n=1 Tax=Streptomyces sp. NBRC 110611 TaxID=1621259 RepID=UPI00083648F3|nr:alpha/beta fold hydrolase [Streptomyces sp. NBRC 110611]